MSTPITINNDYKVGIKKEVVSALRPLFDATNYPDPNLAGKISVNLEYPLTEAKYPSIYITYTEGSLQNAGIGHYELETDDDGHPVIFYHWIFDGSINFNVLALTPIDRDQASAGLINILALGHNSTEFDGFFTDISDDSYVKLQMLTDKIYPLGENTAPAPWGETDRQVFANTYSVRVFGEFQTEPRTGQLIVVKRVDLYPYRLNEQLPPW
jgi:hypothetical protein